MTEHTPPANVRPYRRLSASGTESRTTANGRKQLWRQVGWHGQTGAFYALDEHPSRHEPGSYAPLWVLVDDEPLELDAYADPEVIQAQDSDNRPAWAWRCWGSATCKGWVGIDLYSEEAARRELARHIADEHKEATS